MAREPKIGAFLDDDEKALVTAIEQKKYKAGTNFLTSDHLEHFQAAARATLNEERARISLRLPKSDLERLKAKALREGIPYQILIGSILHKAVSG